MPDVSNSSPMGGTTGSVIGAIPDLPAVPGSVAFIHNVDTAPAYWWLNILWVVLVDGAATGGRYSLMHETLPKGSGAPWTRRSISRPCIKRTRPGWAGRLSQRPRRLECGGSCSLL